MASAHEEEEEEEAPMFCAEFSEVMEECALPEEPAGAAFRAAVATAAKEEQAARAEHQLAELLHQAQLGWLLPSLAEYQLADTAQLRQLLAQPSAGLLTELDSFGCGESERQKLLDALGPIPLDRARCLQWLEDLPTDLGLDMAQLRAEQPDGAEIAAALDSTRELRDSFGLGSIGQRVRFERMAREFLATGESSGSPVRGATGQVWSARFLEATNELYDMHMGTENMGPLLYSLVRFCKPSQVLEVGAGYTSIFLLQALHDNAAEISNYGALLRTGQCTCGEVPWCVEPELARLNADQPTLHTVDSMAHESTTAHKVVECAQLLGLDQQLQLHEADIWQLEWTGGELDLLWLDFGAGSRLDELLSVWWPRLRNGGLVLVHSTVTNSHSRGWLDRLRQRQAGGDDGGGGGLAAGEYVTLSLLEPHKMFQNSTTLIQKRVGGYQEPILTQWP